jgi:ubiquitin C-terminal hydrolase
VCKNNMLPFVESSRTTVVVPPPQREVARAVQNLGNTCYMNAVLQALAHAPELCMAMDVQSHRLSCPIYKENVQKIANRSGPGSATSSRSSSPDHFLRHGGDQDLYSADPSRIGAVGTRKSRRTRSPTSSSIFGSSSLSPNEGTNTPSRQDDPNATKFCALCEVEQHMNNVHRGSHNGSPVAPTNFVHGFVEHVAPWFKLGQQEDSHEFMRLLIDAMQKSCKQARPHLSVLHHDPGNPQDTPPEQTSGVMSDDDDDNNNRHYDGGDNESSPVKQNNHQQDTEYPFQLFRGMVESKVMCGQCNSTSSTMDPIEDLGLDVSPVSPSSTELDSVVDALKRFSRVEELDAGYKCEKCGKVGRATKQCRLASIPPILTLHLKRFRYGAIADPTSRATGANGSSNGTVRRSQRSSEVSQLMNAVSTEWMSGKSGAAKIEGHSEFKPVLDLKPYLTDELRTDQATTLCRLFAVIVHVGKNSHSGHYLSYVRNIEKNEWWKMDDSRVTLVDEKEVLNAEAYMLLYRVAGHPYSNHLKCQVEMLKEKYAQQQAAALAKKTTSTITPIKSSSGSSPANSAPANGAPANGASTIGAPANSAPTNGGGPAASVKHNPRKRKAPEFTCGEDWARKKAFVPENFVAGLRDIEAKVSEYVSFTPTFMRMLREQASRPNAKVGHGPSSGICCTYKIIAATSSSFFLLVLVISRRTVL